jgi:uncharacterized repeat protein (TIGR03803 family)
MKRTLLCIFLLFEISGFAQTYTFTTLVIFPNSSQKSAVNPMAPTIDGLGNIYGISFRGGANDGGTLFKVTPAGSLSVLYSFPNNTFPQGAVVRDSHGNLYGGTARGGTYNEGFIFKVTSAGKMTILHSFSSSAVSGYYSLARDSGGNLYGYDASGNGSLFKLTPRGEYTILYAFCSLSDCADGGGPFASGPAGGPIIMPDGNLYGMTGGGGTLGYGTIFRITPQGQQTILYNFLGGSDGANPHSKLTKDSAGNLYGTTYSGGAFGGGTVFKLSPSGVESVLYNFCALTACAQCKEPKWPLNVHAECYQ